MKCEEHSIFAMDVEGALTYVIVFQNFLI